MSTQALRTCVYLRRLEFLKQRTAEAQRLLAAAEQRALEAGAFRHSSTTVDSPEQPRTLLRHRRRG